MEPLKALYGHRYRSPIGWFEVRKAALIEPNPVLKAMAKVQLIRERLRTTQSPQKLYADMRKRELEFGVGDWGL